MAEWIACPACKLKHAARPDGLCPRCKAPAGETAALSAAPAFEAAPALAAPSHAEAEPEISTGARIAGWVLYANALVAIVSLLATGTKPTGPTGMGSLVSIVVDVAIATSLVKGNRNWVGWALLRAVLGGAILTPILWSNAGPAAGILQILYSLGLVLLLLGDAGVPRIATGLVPSAGALVLVLAMVSSTGTARAIRGVAADAVDRGHLVQLEGDGGSWLLPLPEGTWHRSRAPEGIDRMASWPEQDAHVMVSSKAAPPGSRIDLLAAVEGLVTEMRKADPSFVEADRRFVRPRRGSGIAIRATLRAEGVEAEGWYVLVVDGNRVAIAIGLAPRERFEELGDGLLALAEGIDLGE